MGRPKRRRLSRRQLLTGFGVGTGVLVAGGLAGLTSISNALWAEPAPVGPSTRPSPPRPRQVARPRRFGPSRTALENQHEGARGFSLTRHRFGDDSDRQLEGYASDTSVAAGDRLDFHVSVGSAQRFRILVYRVGDYAGTGARLVARSPELAGLRRPVPTPRPDSGLISCDWPVSWTLRTGRDWTSGYYLALLTSADGYHRWVPFVVREPRRVSDLLVVVGTATYQAYNQWPTDLATGKSLYYGYTAAGTSSYGSRARAVSHDRPYSGDGLPKMADQDIGFVRWLEGTGHDLTYATSEDLHAGRLPLERYRAIVFCGHDEYWSPAMRQRTTQARDAGTALLFMTANNVYWRTSYAPAAGVPHRIVECPKAQGTGVDGSRRELDQWRTTDPEQQLLGSQYVTILRGRSPLVVRGAEHWFWAGAGVRDGDRIPYLVTGEADHQASGTPLPRYRERVLLSASPFTSVYGRRETQHTQLYQAESGAWVFVAGTFGWPEALYDPRRYDRRIERATRNLLTKVVNAG